MVNDTVLDERCNEALHSKVTPSLQICMPLIAASVCEQMDELSGLPLISYTTGYADPLKSSSDDTNNFGVDSNCITSDYDDETNV